MKCAFGAAILCLVVMVTRATKLPDFCNGLDCPKYALKNKTKDFEIRYYTNTVWYGTNLAGIDYNAANYKLFMRLFDYIQGANEKKMKIAMTAPVINRIIPGQGPACENNFTMSFFNSPKVVNPPKPTDPTVFIHSFNAMTVYVTGFGGFADQQKYQEHALSLGKALDKAGIQFNKNVYYTAGYDSPFKLFNRHNEVWFMPA